MNANRSEFEAVQRILVRGVNWLGDAVMTTPALLRLRERFPRASITVLSPEKLGDLWWQHPAVDEVLLFGPDEGPWCISRQLRTRGFDLGIALPNSFRVALELWLSRIPIRMGFGGNGRSPFLTHVPLRPSSHVKMVKRTRSQAVRLSGTPAQSPEAPPRAHQIHHYLDLIGSTGASAQPVAPCLKVTAEEIAQFQRKFLPAGAFPSAARPFWIGLNPGAEYGPAKRWPAEHFAAVAATFNRQSPCTWLVFGGSRDRELAETICRGIESSKRGGSGAPVAPVVNLAGQTSLRELMAGLQLCEALVTNDTGPMHVAAALGTPVVVPFGSTSPELTGPGEPGDPRHRLLRSPSPPGCSPCFLRECPIDSRCLTRISVEQVTTALFEVTTRKPAAKSL